MPLAVASVGSQWSLITAVGVLVICLTIGQWLGILPGAPSAASLDITPPQGVERFFGGVLNLAACALVMVVLTISMRTVPIPQLNTALQRLQDHSPGWSPPPPRSSGPHQHGTQ